MTDLAKRRTGTTGRNDDYVLLRRMAWATAIILWALLAAAVIQAHAETTPQGTAAVLAGSRTDLAMNSALLGSTTPAAKLPAAPEPAQPKDDVPAFHPLTDF
jgi:hypothetical protein